VDIKETSGGLHCINPKFLKLQVEKSRRNLELNTIDLLYLHNPYEMQSTYMSQDKFLTELHKIFEFFEQLVQNNLIKQYGLATSTCFRSPPEMHQAHLNLQKIVHIAEAVGGPQHHFKFIEVPINIAMPEALIYPWQSIDPNPAMKDNSSLVLLAAANRLRMNLVGCQPLYQGKVIQLKLKEMGLEDLGARHLQLMRSIPARCLITTLVGMKTMRHTMSNLEVAKLDPLGSALFAQTIKGISM